MTIQFNIHYGAQQGENLFVNIEQEDGSVRSLRMDNVDYELWQCSSQFIVHSSQLRYYYSVKNGDCEINKEWTTQAHMIQVGRNGLNRYTTWDTWIFIPHDSYLYSSAFTECINRRERREGYLRDNPCSIRLKVRAPQLRSYERLVMIGGHPVLGEWDLGRAIPCTEQAPNEWVCEVSAEYLADQDIDFKFVAVGGEDLWETEDNRRLHVPRLKQGEVVEYELSQAFFKIWNVKVAGTLIPVFSLRTEGSFGVGDFGDLKRMIDWVADTNQRVLQVLPINDTTVYHTWKDSYPYSCISIFALHPQYVDFRQLPPLKDKKKAKELETVRRQLNQLQSIDYERMIQAKEEYLELLFKQEGKEVLASEDFRQWFKEEERWLVPYAEFCVNRDKKLSPLTSPLGSAALHSKDLSPQKYYYIQYVLACQMKSAHEYARSKNIILKGDIPIGVQRNGCDVWQEPQYFNLNGQAGAPPDDFSTEGQNWGFPTYNWDNILKDDCQWWVRHFQNMQKYFDAYRIDHVLGFFRIWEVPMPDTSGIRGQFQPALALSKEEIAGYGVELREELFLRDHKNPELWHPFIAAHRTSCYQSLSEDEKQRFNRLYDDFFYHRNDHFWQEQAMKKLPRLIEATRMLVCAEDLGMIPQCVPTVLNDLRILSLEVQSMPKEYGQRFGHPERYPYRSVCTIDSHDMPTLRMWWDEDYDRAQEYYSTMLGRRDEAPHPLPAWLARDIMLRNLQSESMLCILSLQDWLAISDELRLADASAERINIPANPNHYWRYRMHITIDEMLANHRFCDDVAEMIKQSGR